MDNEVTVQALLRRSNGVVDLDDSKGHGGAGLVFAEANVAELGLESDGDTIGTKETASDDGTDNSDENSLGADSSDGGVVTRADLLSDGTTDVVGVGGVRDLELGGALRASGKDLGVEGTESDGVGADAGDRTSTTSAHVAGDNEVHILRVEEATSDGKGLDSLVDGGSLASKEGRDLLVADAVSDATSSASDDSSRRNLQNDGIRVAVRESGSRGRGAH
jgi:hypothetical protein